MITVATTNCPRLTRNSSPAHWTNCDSASTSLVTRETSEPRRSVFWVSTERSCTCRNATVRRWPDRLRSPGTSGRHRVRAPGRHQDGDPRREARPSDEPEVSARWIQKASVDCLLHGDRHDHSAESPRVPSESEAEAGPDLRRVRQSPTDGLVLRRDRCLSPMLDVDSALTWRIFLASEQVVVLVGSQRGPLGDGVSRS